MNSEPQNTYPTSLDRNFQSLDPNIQPLKVLADWHSTDDLLDELRTYVQAMVSAMGPSFLEQVTAHLKTLHPKP